MHNAGNVEVKIEVAAQWYQGAGLVESHLETPGSITARTRVAQRAPQNDGRFL